MEPAKYTKNARGNWIVNTEWKKWKDAKFKKAEKSTFKAVKGKIMTEENHKANWKEVAYSIADGKTILFCCCMAGTAEPYKGCGAVGIKSTKASKLRELLEPRFE